MGIQISKTTAYVSQGPVAGTTLISKTTMYISGQIPPPRRNTYTFIP